MKLTKYQKKNRKFINRKNVVWAYVGEIITEGSRRMIMEFDGKTSKTTWIKAWLDDSVDEII